MGKVYEIKIKGNPKQQKISTLQTPNSREFQRYRPQTAENLNVTDPKQQKIKTLQTPNSRKFQRYRPQTAEN